MSRLKLCLKILATALVILTLVFLAWAYKELGELKKSTSSGWFHPPTRFYSAPIKIQWAQEISSLRLSQILNESGYQERGPSQSLDSKEFTFLPASLCERKLGALLSAGTRTCFFILNENQENLVVELSPKKVLRILKVENGNAQDLESFELPPVLFTQVSQGKPILRSFTPLSQIPRHCLDGVLAIEDDRFLRHGGVSLRGILRAALVNLKQGRFSQGGSTLTQQLVKNKFLSHEKTLKRKVKEALLSLLLETFLTKEQILESYLNYIYWGQSGPFAVHGIQEASKHYFGKDVNTLELSECSLLAGAIKGPGIYGPHKEKSLARQKEVLERMKELQLVTNKEVLAALENPPQILKGKKKVLRAPYYIEAATLEAKKILGSEVSLDGVSIYTELDLFAQEILDHTMDKYLQGRSQGFRGSVLVGDNQNFSVVALSNGLSQSLNFNSALYGKRQIGSLAKPFVYLTALEEKGVALNPLTQISNAPFTYEYEGQSWTPKNYSSKNQQELYPLYQALSRSKNIPTVRLMSKVGYKKVYKNLIRYGFEKFSPITPSLALGAFEASPLEVMQAYMNLARPKPLKLSPSFIWKLKDQKGNSLYERDLSFLESPDSFTDEKRMLLEMMKQTLVTGTARSSQRLSLQGVYAGKTGTTNEHKDGWFAALSPHYTYVSWVSEAPFLTDRGIKITGATAALPLWLRMIPALEHAGRTSFEDWPVSDSLELQSFEDENGQMIPLLLRKDDFSI